jgi:RNA polymerase sigma-70 factor (ECF subfamily)
MFFFSDTNEEIKEPLSDEEVLRRSYEDPRLFEILIDRYEEKFLRRARAVVFDDEIAKDVVQDTFVKIYSYGRRFRPIEGARFSSWGYKILLNTCFRWYGKTKKEASKVVVMDDELENKLFNEGDGVEDSFNGDYIESLVDRLPETFARMVRLYVNESKTYEEIAEIEKTSPGAIKVRMHRAREALRDLVKEIPYF